ncbi:hypothetical protein C1I92_23625 [Jiangella anatolica]|uniref:Uncharacterized protein n=1 Tax=Jiangella anatolica TaxID=2670374 RepID=A0A2W2C5A0_9ACTN|nr:hypothetical protein C1I92_23625 [Jiangella anatolica]
MFRRRIRSPSPEERRRHVARPGIAQPQAVRRHRRAEPDRPQQLLELVVGLQLERQDALHRRAGRGRLGRRARVAAEHDQAELVVERRLGDR